MPPPPKDGDAVVAPNQPWEEDGTAEVTPLPPFPSGPRTMDLENRPSGNFVVTRAEHWLGLVVVQAGHEPATPTHTFPIISTSKSEIAIGDDWFHVMPDGFVIWFTG